MSPAFAVGQNLPAKGLDFEVVKPTRRQAKKEALMLDSSLPYRLSPIKHAKTIVKCRARGKAKRTLTKQAIGYFGCWADKAGRAAGKYHTFGIAATGYKWPCAMQ